MVGTAVRPRGTVPRTAVALIVAAGAAWLLVALIGTLAQALVGTPVLGTSGANGDMGYPPHAVSDLLWGGYGVAIVGGGLGLLAIAIGWTGFRRGERWAWYAILVLPAVGALAAFDDERQFGGWWTFLWSGLPALLGAMVSFRAFFVPKEDPPPGAIPR